MPVEEGAEEYVQRPAAGADSSPRLAAMVASQSTVRLIMVLGSNNRFWGPINLGLRKVSLTNATNDSEVFGTKFVVKY